MRKITCLAFSFIICLQAFAQQNDSSRAHLIPEIVVTATRTQKSPDAVARSITVLNDSAIQRSGLRDLASLLAQQQGITAIGVNQNPGMTESVFMRGANSNQTLFLIDGVRISDPSTVNNQLDLTELPLFNVKQLEVVRGSHSTLFGSSGIGGVVNLITPSLQSPGWHLNSNIGVGNFGSGTFESHENILLNRSFQNGWYANVSVFNTNVIGLDATVDTVTNPEAFKSYDRDNFNLTRAGIKIGYQKNRWNAFLNYDFTYERTDFDKQGFKYNNPFGPNPNAWYDGDSTRIFTKRHLINYHVEYSFPKNFNLMAYGGFTHLERSTIDDSSIIDLQKDYDHTFSSATYHGTEMNHDLQLTWNKKFFTALIGTGMQQETMGYQTTYFTLFESGPYESEVNLDSLHLKATTLQAFAQVDLNAGFISPVINKLNLVAGIRYNHHNLFGNVTTFEINPSWMLKNNTLIYASFSSGFNAPSLYELYSPDSYYTSGITRGNPNLKPETSQSFEFGIKQHIAEISWNVALYQTTVNNLVSYVYLWNPDVPIDSLETNFNRDDYRGDTYLNIGKQTSRGAEISVEIPVDKKISISANLNLVFGKLNFNTNEIDTSHTHGNLIQLYDNGAFLTKDVQTEGLTRRPSSASFVLQYYPVEKLLLQAESNWIGSKNDVYYDNNIHPFGALNTSLVSDYVLFNVMAQYSFSNHMTLSTRGENIFNAKYTEIYGFTTKGRGLYLSLVANW